MTFSLVLPSTLLKFTNQLHRNWIQLTDVFLYSLMELKTVRTSPQTCHPRSSCYLIYLISWNFFYPNGIAVLSSSFMFWSDNVIWNSCISHYNISLSTFTTVEARANVESFGKYVWKYKSNLRWVCFIFSKAIIGQMYLCLVHFSLGNWWHLTVII